MRRLTRSALVAALALGLVALVPLTASAEDAIPKDTVLVHVTKDGKPLAAQSIKVIGVPPGGGEVSYGEQKTDAQGVATFHIPFRPGLVLTAYTTYEGVQYKGPEGSYAGSPKFGLALNPQGLREVRRRRHPRRPLLRAPEPPGGRARRRLPRLHRGALGGQRLPGHLRPQGRPGDPAARAASTTSTA